MHFREESLLLNQKLGQYHQSLIGFYLTQKLNFEGKKFSLYLSEHAALFHRSSALALVKIMK